MKKIFIILFYCLIFIIGFFNRETILHWIQDGDPSSLPLMFFLALFLSMIPVVPFTLFAGLMGAKYGILLGLVINWFGGLSAAVLYYVLARYLFTDYFKIYIKKFKRLHKSHEMLRENSFLSITISRMIPLIPPPVINIYSGTSKIPFPTYLSASAIGLIPPMFMFAFGGNQILSSIGTFILALIGYASFLLFIFAIYKWKQRDGSHASNPERGSA